MDGNNPTNSLHTAVIGLIYAAGIVVSVMGADRGTECDQSGDLSDGRDGTVVTLDELASWR